jgi:uridine phosphorylase
MDGGAGTEFLSEAQAAVIEPRRGTGEPPVPPGLIMSYTSEDLAQIRASLDLEQPASRRVDFAWLWELSPVWEGVALAGPALGAPAAAILMERLIALGARWIVGVGSCGSLQPHAPIGQVILPTGALIEEGTSSHYQGPGVSPTPDPSLVQEIRRAMSLESIHALGGRIWTTDAPFRETVEKVTRYQKSGILAVEMEASALMTVARFRRVAFASVLRVVSDEIGSLRWKRGFSDPSYRDGLARVSRIVVQVLRHLGSLSGGKAFHGEDR